MCQIHVITTSRADFTIWYPIINRLLLEEYFQVKVIVSGLHYSSELGNTYEEVKRKLDENIIVELPITKKIDNYEFISEMFLNYNNYINTPNNKPDLILFLGDRYELLPLLNVAILNRVIIGHFYPAECDISFCIDTQVRDAITKSAHLFFVTHDDYKKRLLGMGEEEWRIAVVGNSSINQSVNKNDKNIYRFFESKDIQIPQGFQLVNCCYHPPTIEKGIWKKELPEMIEALDFFNDKYIYIWSGINSDPDSFEMKTYLLSKIRSKKNHYYFDSLGGDNYKSLLLNAAFTIGNSSSGLYEAPIFNCPTINVGVRQAGRLHGDSILNVKAEKEIIINAIRKINSDNLIFENVFYNPSFPDNIVEHIKNNITSKNIRLKRLNIDEGYTLRRVPDYL